MSDSSSTCTINCRQILNKIEARNNTIDLLKARLNGMIKQYKQIIDEIATSKNILVESKIIDDQILPIMCEINSISKLIDEKKELWDSKLKRLSLQIQTTNTQIRRLHFADDEHDIINIIIGRQDGFVDTDCDYSTFIWSLIVENEQNYYHLITNYYNIFTNHNDLKIAPSFEFLYKNYNTKILQLISTQEPDNIELANDIKEILNEQKLKIITTILNQNFDKYVKIKNILYKLKCELQILREQREVILNHIKELNQNIDDDEERLCFPS